jgi:hypothetical protein
MEEHRVRAVVYRATWSVLTVALCAAIAVWGVEIGAPLGSGINATAPASQPNDVPRIVTVNPDLGLPDVASLCAEIAPKAKNITIESVAGQIISTDHC